MMKTPDIKIYAETVEDTAMAQIKTISEHPAFRDSTIRIMPDVHAGKGCVCGFTARLGDKVVPSLIGVDIGCGMLAARIPESVKIDFPVLDQMIRKVVPLGQAVHGQAQDCPEDADPAKTLAVRHGGYDVSRIRASLGTLGGGNHFVEIDQDPESGDRWLIVHTGSRGFGMLVAKHWQAQAVASCRKSAYETEVKPLIARLKAEGRISEIEKEVKAFWEKFQVPEDLAYLTGEDAQGYVHDMKIAQRWAQVSRMMIVTRIFQAMGWDLGETFETVHNYLGEDGIIRKSAVAAPLGVRILIPISMGFGSLICEGLGADDWLQSAPHGAGRRMSRSQAKATVSMEEYRKAMQGIWTSSVSESTLDESPMAYKDADEIIRQIAPTARIVSIIKPIYSLKAES